MNKAELCVAYGNLVDCLFWDVGKTLLCDLGCEFWASTGKMAGYAPN